MHSVPKEYANVRRFYVTKYGESKGIDMFEAYMRRRGSSPAKTGVSTKITVVPWIPMRTVYRKTITRRRGTNLVIKSRVSK
tara:strand:- start:235 stop:477 length:243 start_codon:yes stop_codon:yes gene_type:complete